MDRGYSSQAGPASSDLLNYQKQLLERKSSLSRTPTNPRSPAASALPPNQTTLVSGATRRWKPGHRTGQSVDAVRSRWEEKISREASPERSQSPFKQPPPPSQPPLPRKTATPVTPTDPIFSSTPYTPSAQVQRGFEHRQHEDTATHSRTYAFARSASPDSRPAQLNSSLKRVESMRSKWEGTSQTDNTPSNSTQSTSFSVPTNLTGSSVLSRSSSVSSTTSTRRLDSIRSKWLEREQESLNDGTLQLGSPASPRKHQFDPRSLSKELPRPPSEERFNTIASPIRDAPISSPVHRDYDSQVTPKAFKRHTMPSFDSTSDRIERQDTGDSISRVAQPSFATPAPSPIRLSTSSDLQSSSISAVQSLGDYTLEKSGSRTRRQIQPDYYPPPLSPSASTVMYPTQYRSSHMQKKYGSSLGDGRRLGRHLPRIASGDGNSGTEEPTVPDRRRNRRARQQEPSQELVIPGITGASDVAGVPGRLRLSRASKANAPAPLPSSRLVPGLWADVQRNLLQAYEYLCHVGEAQQWIEGCLGEELGFGVVEMEDGLRNGVVLAKLVRIFKGASAVRKIHEATKIDYRHVDNINHFIQFVREEGLPESFIFETLDLYEKKNFPKVIFSIHALSHLLARRGKAERIGNLLGQLKFSDDQLEQTQKGLEHAGVTLPNFSNVGRELALEINEEPDIEIETEDERRDRLLLENEVSIIKLQTQARAYMIRRDYTTKKAQLKFSEKYARKLQAQCRGAMVRDIFRRNRRMHAQMSTWVIRLQAAARGALVRRQRNQQRRLIAAKLRSIVKIQAQARGVVQRRRFSRLKTALSSCKFTITKLQTLSRMKLVKRSHKELKKHLESPQINFSIVGLQAMCRGALQRRKEARRRELLRAASRKFVGLQAQVRGVLYRRRIRAKLAKLTDVTQTIIRIQAAARAYLAGKRLLNLIRGLRKATPSTISFQSYARAALTRRRHEQLRKALTQVQVIKSIGSLQSLARAAIVRNRRQEERKKLEFCAPDVIGLQSQCRGVLIRNRYWPWRDHLHANVPALIFLQSLIRGAVNRKKFRAKMAYYRANLDKVIKIQSLVRAKETREQYRQLTLGQNVNIGTIKNFVHLLDDSETDFKEEIEIEKRRERLVKSIRENQALETDISELDTKIALVVQNVKSFDELVRARRRHGADSAAAHAARASVLAAHGDPFAGPNTLDHATKRKLELYQQLFYVLQTHSEYLARLVFRLSAQGTDDKTKKLVERVILTLFGYGQNRREDYLILKFFQHAIFEEVQAAVSPTALASGYPIYLNLAVSYVKPKQISFFRDCFQSIIRSILAEEDLDLETDPVALHVNRTNVEEMRTGKISSIPKDVSFREAIENYYPETRTDYINNLQRLRHLANEFLQVILSSAARLPYGIRYIAHETLTTFQQKFSNEPPGNLTASVGKLIYYRFINPAIVTPETFDIVDNTINPVQRKNLAAIAKVLNQLAIGRVFDNDDISLVPLNDFIETASAKMAAWFLQVADVPEPEVQLNAYEFLDVALQPKPIFISPNEVYSMHRVLTQHAQYLTPRRDDPLRIIIQELGGVPTIGSHELNEARDRAVTLELTNRFAQVEDPHAIEKALWVQAKRSVLAILRVQPAKDLIESLMQPVAEEHESMWEEIIERDLMADELRHHERRMPSTTAADAAYRLEDIQSFSFREVKAHAISCLLKLEKQDKVTRNDGYQGILNAIAGDVRSKHRKRLERQREMESMNDVLVSLAERKKHYLEQIESYNNYIEASMMTMQRGKGKKRFVMPFTKQYFHLRDLHRSGKNPQFGSYKYSALDFYEKGILLSIDQFSPRQFDRIHIILSSNNVGVFAVELQNGLSGDSNITDVRVDDLLHAQFENKPSLALFNGTVKFNVNLLLYQINKKFYV